MNITRTIEAAQKHRELSQDHRWAFDRFIAAMKPLQYADEITPAAALTYLDDTFPSGNGKTYNNNLTMLNVIFKACLIRAGLPASPFAAIPRRVVKSVEHFRPLTADEFRAIFAAAAEPWKSAASPARAKKAGENWFQGIPEKGENIT